MFINGTTLPHKDILCFFSLLYYIYMAFYCWQVYPCLLFCGLTDAVKATISIAASYVIKFDKNGNMKLLLATN